MAFLSQFLPADQVLVMDDRQVEVLANHVHAVMLRETLRNQQVRGAITKELGPLAQKVARLKTTATK